MVNIGDNAILKGKNKGQIKADESGKEEEGPSEKIESGHWFKRQSGLGMGSVSLIILIEGVETTYKLITASTSPGICFLVDVEKQPLQEPDVIWNCQSPFCG